jgi:RHS repeat-associated protein
LFSWGATPAITDRNGNQITYTASTGVFKDTLNTTVLTVTGTAPNPVSMSYTPPAGGSASVTITYRTYTVATNFGASGISESHASSTALVDTITLADNTKYIFTYEPTPSVPSSGACTPLAGTYQNYCVTARIASVSLPTGGSISYGYLGGANGINGVDGSTATLTRTVSDGTTSNQWTYTHLTNGANSVTDPSGSIAYVSFNGIYEVSRIIQQKINGTQTLVASVYTCYNTTSPAWNTCSPTTATPPFTRRTVFTQFPDQTGKESETDENYDSYGRLTERDNYDFGALGSGTPGGVLRKESLVYALLSQTLSGVSQSFEVPTSDTITDGAGTQYAKTTYAYDSAGSITTTSGIPQHVAVTGSHGLVSSITSSVTSTATLQSTYKYYDTGVLQSVTDVNSAITTYGYGTTYGSTASCYGAFPTGVTLPLSLSRSYAWNCTGGVMISATDENSQTISNNYTTDTSFWRPESIQDQLLNTTSLAYTTTQIENALNFNNNTSTADTVTTADGLGRPIYAQRRQAYGLNSFDSAQYVYDSLGRRSQVSMPYVAGKGQAPTSPIFTTTSYDALNRTTQVADGGSGTATLTYSQNDVYQEVGPSPTGENTKRKQLEYDGLGRLTSVCEITAGTTSWPGGTCGQTNAKTGYWTKYQYSPLGLLTSVVQNAQSTSTQIRSYGYDQLGRLVSETNPESQTTSYTYDSNSACGATAYKADLVKKADAVGNTSCYTYDVLHRVLSITYTGGSNNTPTKHFVYDAATVNGVGMPYAKGHLAEAYTGSSSSKTTDLGFGYSIRGEATDVYESTPHSGTAPNNYYHVSATYWPHGALNALSGIPGVPTVYYGTPQTDGSGVDGEGRLTKVTVSGTGQTPVTAVQYTTTGTSQPIGSMTQVTFGSGDFDNFNYDSNTGRMTGYQFNIGTSGQAAIGVLTWNPNGTLQKLAITDAVNTNDTQTCNYGYDDLARIASVNCANGATNKWNQTFAFDPVGNITKTVPTGGTGTTFQPTYSFSTNRFTAIPGVTPTYDANGDVTADGLHTYGWDADGKATAVDGVSITYDALDRAVEQNRSGTYTQIVYGPQGMKLALAIGQALQKAFVPLPGGAHAVYTNAGLAYVGHNDWLGSQRMGSTPSRSMSFNVGYGPYGEAYGTSGVADLSFTGENQDTVTTFGGLYDFMFREYNPSHSRWLSPDPAGLGAGDFSNPQSWNRYAYVNNMPLNYVDPSGLACYPLEKLMFGSCAGFLGNDYFGESWNEFAPLAVGPTQTWWDDGWHSYTPTTSAGLLTQNPTQTSCDNIYVCAPANNRTPQKQQQTKQQKCAAAKANLAAIGSQGNAMVKTMFKETGVGMGIGCVAGFVGTEVVLTPAALPIAAADCVVGAIGGGITAVGVFAISNAGDIVSGDISEAKAVAQVVQNCF